MTGQLTLHLLEITAPKGVIAGQYRRVMSYYLLSKPFVPASTLSGAIANAELRKTGKLPEVITSPALPVTEDGKPVLLSHYFAGQVGRKSDKFLEVPNVLKAERKELPKDGKPRVGELVFPVGKEGNYNAYRKYSPRTEVEMHVAIDRDLGAGKRGMLYAYEYLRVNKLWALSSEPFEGEIAIGRGKNRHFLKAEVRVKKRDVVRFDPNNLKGTLYCITPCAPTLFGRGLFKLKDYWGEFSVYSSWFTTDKLAGQRPSFRVLREGSLLEVEGVGDWDALVRLMPAGLNLALPVSDLMEVAGWYA